MVTAGIDFCNEDIRTAIRGFGLGAAEISGKVDHLLKLATDIDVSLCVHGNTAGSGNACATAEVI